MVRYVGGEIENTKKDVEIGGQKKGTPRPREMKERGRKGGRETERARARGRDRASVGVGEWMWVGGRLLSRVRTRMRAHEFARA